MGSYTSKISPGNNDRNNDRNINKTFSNSRKLHKPPISGNDALRALIAAEHIDGYNLAISKNKYNRKARFGNNYMPTFDVVQRSIPSHDPSQPWPSGQVVWMEPTADGGLPHTRPPYYICMSKTYPEDKLENTLLHERIHVSQRMYPNEWIDMVKHAWDMPIWNDVLPSNLEDRRRLNPDILMAPHFVWKNEYIPCSIFIDLTNPSLHNIQLVWYHIPSRTIRTDVSTVPGWQDFFGTIPHGEHPYEIAAYLLSDDSASCPAKNAIKSVLFKLDLNDKV
jgi:hypothetical protein